MAEKALKRKHRPKTAPAAAQAARRLHLVDAARDLDSREPEQDLGAHYSAGPAYGLSLAALPPRDGRANDEVDLAEQHLRGATPGEPLPAALRRRYEDALGHDLGAVRIHRGLAAERAADDLQARAFTHRNHIWLGPRADPGDARLMAHELTHVVQQGHAPALPARMAVGLHANRAAGGPRHAATPRRSGPAPAPATGGGAVQRWSLMGGLRRIGGSVVSGVRAVGRGIASVGRNLLNMGRGALMALVRRVSPEFARLFERDGIRGFLRDLIARGFRSLFGGVIGRVRRIFNFGNIGARFRSLGSAFVTIVGQLARNDCSGITRAAERFGSFMSRTFEPIASRIRSMADAVSGFFRDVWNAVGAPIMRFLREIGGALWQSIRGFISSIGRVISRVKNALGSAWSRVKGWMGIEAEDGTGEGGGLWNWVKDKAAALWNRIKRPLQPILGPLRVVGGVLLVLSPVGPILLVIRAWPHLRQAFQWVRERWRDLNLVVRARQFFANTVLPAVRDGATRVGEFLVGAADWFLGLLGRVSSGIQSVTGRLGRGILAPLGRVVGFIAGNFRRMVEWARSGLRWASSNARSLFRRLVEFIQPIIDVLRRIIAIAVNPFGIPGLLMGTLWRIIPDCLKGPIIDFILGILIRVIRAIPGMFALGVLWPFIRAAVVGFLERVRSFATQRKVDVSNKIARIISGQSPSFAFGYLRGILLGLWDGIAGPFIAIAQIFELPGMIRGFLNSLGLRICDLLRVIRCFAATITERAIGAYDALLEGARDLLQNPGRILELIRCAIEAALSAVSAIGASVADQMMRMFEGPDDALGEQLGRLTGSFLVDAVLAFFTAGASTATTVIRQVANFLRTIGRNLMRVVRMVARLIPRFLGFIRKIGGMFRRAGSSAGGLLGRIGGFFRRVAAWFQRLMQRVGRRFSRGRPRAGRRGRPGGRRRGRDRRRRRTSAAQRERRQRLVIRIITGRLRRGIGKIRLLALITFLKLRYRIRRLRLQRRGGGRYNVHVANSAAVDIPTYEVHLDQVGGRPEARLRRSAGGRPSAGTLAVTSHSAPRRQTPSAALEAAGYSAYSQGVFRSLGATAYRPNWVETRLRRPLPSLRRLERSLVGRIRRAASSAITRTRNLGKVEQRLRLGAPAATSRLWHGGHLVGNQFGGPARQWNMVPMTANLNVQAFLAMENWLRAQWARLRGPGRGSRGNARLRFKVSAIGYRDQYSVTNSQVLAAGVPERSSGSGRASVSVPGFIPSDIRAEVEFSGRGVQATGFTRSPSWQRWGRPETALRTTAIAGPNDVMMRLGTRISSRPGAIPPRTSRTALVNNRAVFSFRQWRP